MLSVLFALLCFAALAHASAPAFRLNFPDRVQPPEDLADLAGGMSHLVIDALAQGPVSLTDGDGTPTYTITEFLDKGGCGAVFLATNERDSAARQVALKIFNPSNSADAFLEPNEVHILKWMQRSRNPNLKKHVMQFNEHFTLHGTHVVSLEYVPGLPLDMFRSEVARRLKAKHVRFTLAQTRALARSIFHGVAALHSHYVFHGDLKESNIMITTDPDDVKQVPCEVDVLADVVCVDLGNTRDIVKILTAAPEVCKPDIDFSHSHMTTPDGRLELTAHEITGMGTLGWRAPEIIFTDKDKVSPKSDVWNLGLLLMWLFAGSNPANVPRIAVMGPHRKVLEYKGGDWLAELYALELVFGCVPRSYIDEQKKSMQLLYGELLVGDKPATKFCLNFELVDKMWLAKLRATSMDPALRAKASQIWSEMVENPLRSISGRLGSPKSTAPPFGQALKHFLSLLDHLFTWEPKDRWSAARALGSVFLL